MLYQLSYVRLALNDSEAPAQLFDGSKGGGSRRAVLRRHPKRALGSEAKTCCRERCVARLGEAPETAGGESKRS